MHCFIFVTHDVCNCIINFATGNVSLLIHNLFLICKIQLFRIDVHYLLYIQNIYPVRETNSIIRIITKNYYINTLIFIHNIQRAYHIFNALIIFIKSRIQICKVFSRIISVNSY